jgi:hypothetical protein
VSVTGDSERDEALELQRYEQERQERIRRRNRVSGRVVMVIMALALTLLAYDSVTAGLQARRAGRAWTYPTVLALGCALAVIALIALVSRAARRPR